MRICFFVKNSLRKDPRVQKSSSLAHKNGFEVSFVGRKDENYSKEFIEGLPFPCELIDISPKYYGAGVNPIIKILREIYSFYAYVRALVRTRPDIIHANDFDTVPTAWAASKLTGCKVIYDSHEIYCENLGLSRQPLKKKLTIKMEHFFIRRVDQVVSVSYAASKKLAQMYKIKEPLVITNCSFSCDIDINERKHSGFEALYHGRFTVDRGYEEFILAAKYAPKEISFVLRGYGETEANLRKLVKDNGLEDQVVFDKPVEINEMVPAATQSHVGLVLTKPVCVNFEYTVSNKLFEYLNAGLPVILADLPEHRYLVEKYDFGILVDPSSPKEIADAITNLYKDKALYEKLRTNAISASKNLCWEVEGKKFLDLYERLK